MAGSSSVQSYSGGFAEYVCTRGKDWTLKPPSMTFEEAAAIPQAAVIALQGIREGKVQAGQSVLINGAGGGGGTFAIQLTRSCGAEVTAVDNGGKLDFMRSLGADHVIDYTKEDFCKEWPPIRPDSRSRRHSSSSLCFTASGFPIVGSVRCSSE